MKLSNDDEQQGLNILIDTLKEPIRKIISNAIGTDWMPFVLD